MCDIFDKKFFDENFIDDDMEFDWGAVDFEGAIALFSTAGVTPIPTL